MKKLVTYKIEHCNSLCRQFYHNYDDDEHVWCAALNKKIFNFNNSDDIFQDLKEREFPTDCPLVDAKVVSIFTI